MPLDDLISRPAPPAASASLLSAALGGLLFFTGACGPGDDEPAVDAGRDASAPVDAGHDADVTQDAGADTDAGATQDAAADTDAGGDFDAGTDVDAGAEMDAGVDMDAAVSFDAGTDIDAGESLDAGLLDARCDADRVRVVTSQDAAMPISLEDFTALCDAASGYVEIHPTCGGRNSCAGFSYDQTIGVWSEHTCAGLNTCTGYTCVIP